MDPCGLGSSVTRKLATRSCERQACHVREKGRGRRRVALVPCAVRYHRSRRRSLSRWGHASVTWKVAALVEDPIVAQMKAKKREGKFKDLAAIVDGKLDELPLPARAEAVGLVARGDLATGNIKGAIDGLRRALQMQREVGNVSAAVRDGSALTFALASNERDFVQARATLQSLTLLLRGYPRVKPRSHTTMDSSPIRPGICGAPWLGSKPPALKPSG